MDEKPCTVADVQRIVSKECAKMEAKFERAFPDGAEAHRAAHEVMIEAAKAEATFYRELKMEVMKKGVWTLLVVIAGLIVVGLGAKMGIAFK